MSELLHHRQSLGLFQIAAAVLCIGIGVVLVGHVVIVIGAVSFVAVLYVAPRIGVSGVVTALLIYLPFEGLVLTHLPLNLVPWVRYLPEALILLTAVFVAVGELDRLAALFRDRVLVALVAVIAVWVLSAVANRGGLTQSLIGFRSELRFIPVLILALVATRSERDVCRWARVIVWVAVAQALIAFVEFFGGSSARAAFAPHWSITLGGLSVASAVVSPVGRAFGTFANHNELGIFLAGAWAIVATAGSTRLGLTRRGGLAVGAVIATATVLSGSREATIALVAAGILVGAVRFRLPLPQIALGVALLALLLAPAWSSVRATAPSGAKSYNALAERWLALFSAQTWQAQYHSNFRLFLLDSEVRLTAMKAPVLGFGPGSVTDRRRLDTGTSPVFQTLAGTRAVEFNYIYDGNWGLVVVETGVVGLAALFLFLFAIILTGLRDHERSWVGLAVAAVAVEVLLLGFFAPVLQLRSSGALLWVLVGAWIALRHPLGSDDGALDSAPSR